MSHRFLNSFEVSVGVVGFGQIFIFKTLHFDFPHLKDVAFNIDVVTWLRIAKECLLVPTVYAAEATAK